MAAVQDVPASPETAASGVTAAEPCGERHDWRIEAVITTVAMGVLGWASVVGGGFGRYPVLDITLGAVSLALVPLIPRFPQRTVPVALALSALAAVTPAATPAATLAALLVARSRRLPVALAVGAAGIAAHLVREAWRPVGGLPYGWWTLLAVVAYAALIGWGTMLRANQQLVSSLRERAERAETDQARRVAEARAAERTRIAREMHDVLAHRLSLLATYAGALAYRPDAPPEQLSRAAELIRSGVHESLDELREVIGVLRDDSLPDLAATRSPLPGIAGLPTLIEESRAAGADVSVGGPAWPLAPGLPDTAGRTVYRVVQEGLTNARKHAPGEPVRVVLGGAPGAELEVSIVNRLGPAPSPAAARWMPGTGTGLIGLAERLELAGGRLESGAGNGEFRLRARLPWQDATAADTMANTAAGSNATDDTVLRDTVTRAG
jgi:signal transduction histidine kinase